MDAQATWKRCFSNWPEDLPRRGVVVTNFAEQIPFQGFLTSDTMVLLERNAPDALGARMVMIPYPCIQAVKIIDVVKPKTLASLGFEGTLGKKV
jgi:hypothetical protein